MQGVSTEAISMRSTGPLQQQQQQEKKHLDGTAAPQLQLEQQAGVFMLQQQEIHESLQALYKSSFYTNPQRSSPKHDEQSMQNIYKSSFYTSPSNIQPPTPDQEQAQLSANYAFRPSFESSASPLNTLQPSPAVSQPQQPNTTSGPQQPTSSSQMSEASMGHENGQVYLVAMQLSASSPSPPLPEPTTEKQQQQQQLAPVVGTFTHHRQVGRVASLSNDRMMQTIRESQDSAANGALQDSPEVQGLYDRLHRVNSQGQNPAYLEALGARMADHSSQAPRIHKAPSARASFSHTQGNVSRIAHSTSHSIMPRLSTEPARPPAGLMASSPGLQWPAAPTSGDDRELRRPRASGSRSPHVVSGSLASFRLNVDRNSFRHSTEESRSGIQRVMKQMVLSDDAAFMRVQTSLRDITSLAKETKELEMARDPSGATCMNQYVVIKTLGKGSFGKVKLCLNTLDGQLRAIKMVNRAFVLRHLQKNTKALRRRPTRSTTVSTQATSLSQVQEMVVLPGHKMSLDETSWQGAAEASLGSGTTSVGPLESVMREIAVLKKLDHPHVVKLLEVIDPPKSSYVLLVMEYMEGGAIMETKAQAKFDCFPEEVAWNYFRQVCLGLDYLHYNCVVHGDLKPENLLVTSQGDVKIGDFGSSRIINDASACTKIACTPAFQSPECIQGGTECDNPYAADVWALGVCLYCFVFGRLPFSGATMMDISRLILQDAIKVPDDTPVAPQLVDLLERMFVKDPARRITLAEVMEHPWTSSDGDMPLVTLKSQLSPPAVLQVTRLQAMDAIDHSPLASMIRAKLKEKAYAPGAYLFRQFEPARCVYMILSGVVEMVATKPIAAKLEGTGSFSVDLDESFTLECGNVPASNLQDGKLHIDKAAAEDIKKRMSDLIMGRGQEYVAEVRGPGNVIGEVSFDNSVARHRFSARAKDAVVVVILSEDNLKTALKQTYDGDIDSGEGLAFSSHCNNSVNDLLEPSLMRSGEVVQKMLGANIAVDDHAVESL